MASFGYYEDEEVVDEVDELEIDDSLSSLEKIKKYTYSDIILHRLHLARELSELSKHVEYSDFTNVVIPSITQLSNDNESVIRQSLIEQLPELTSQLIKYSGDEQISGVIVPVLDKMIVDESTQVRASSAESLISIAKYLDSEKQKDLILPIINKLSTNPREEEYRIEAAEIIGKIAGVIEEELLKEFAVEQIKILSKDPMFRVRKAVALTIGSISKIYGPDLCTSSLLPIFLQLTKDDIWGVKKACTEAIVLLAQSVTLSARITDLSQIYEILIQDNSRWVRNSAFQNLGQFITTLEADVEIPQSLFDHYSGMVDGLKNKFGDSDTILYCAYSFPGVLQTIGRNKWNLLKPVYSALSKDLQWKVRRTLSHSLHEIAKILGTELTEENLLNTFELFLNDLDQVKVGIIRHISSFLAILSTSSRNSYVSTLLDIQKESVNWRFRQLLAMQIGDIAELYSDEVIKESIIPIAIQLCSDQVTSVRQSISTEIGKFVHHLTNRSPKLLNDFIDQIISFATKDCCYDRQTYAQCCESLADSVDAALFIQHFYPHLITLASDKVPNIRFIISRLFNQKLTSDKFLEIQTQVQSITEKLAQDTDREVRFFANNNVIRKSS